MKSKALIAIEEAIASETDDCIIWTFYPTFSRARVKVHGVFEYVAPIVCKAVHGPAPYPGCQTRRTCGNARCINPRHIQWRGKVVKPPKRWPSRAQKRLAEEAFIEYAVYSCTEKCIAWPFHHVMNEQHHPYGISWKNGERIYTHREVCRRVHGEPPDPSYYACHAPQVCHNTLCINPSHLRWDTNQGNQADRDKDGTITETGLGRSSLTKLGVREIYNSTASTEDLMEIYGVKACVIYGIRSGATFRRITQSGSKSNKKPNDTKDLGPGK